MSKILINILLLGFIVSYSCTSSKNDKANLEQKIILSDIQAWLNLMPGGPGSFHISGAFDLNDSSDVNINLKNIYIYSSDKMIYNINPEFSIQGESISIKPWTKVFQFHNKGRLNIDEALRSTEKIDVRLVFEIDGYSIEKFVKNVELTRAY